MPIVVLNAGKLAFLAVLAGALEGLLARLFVNDLWPGPADLPAAYVEASWTGYNPAPLVGWGPPALAADQHALVQAPPVWFPNLSAYPQQAYGVFVTRGTTILYAERFRGAPLTVASMQLLPYFPAFADTSEF